MKSGHHILCVMVSSTGSMFTTSSPIVVNDQVPADCIYRVISQNGEQILFETMSTPRPAPKVILRSRCRIEQEQYSVTAFSDAWKDWRGTQASEQEKEMKIETSENSVHRAAGNSMRTLILPILKLIFESKECQMILCKRMRIEWGKLMKNEELKKWIKSRIHTWRSVERRRWPDFQRKVTARNLRNGQRGPVRIRKTTATVQYQFFFLKHMLEEICFSNVVIVYVQTKT